MGDIKGYIVNDIIIFIGLIVLYFTTKGILKDISSLQNFYIFEIGLAAFIHLLLIISHWQQSVAWAVSLRSFVIIYYFGMLFVSFITGIFGFIFIFFFAVA